MILYTTFREKNRKMFFKKKGGGKVVGGEISADNYHAIDDSVLCVYKTARVIGSRCETRA